MPTVEDVAHAVLASINSDAGLPLVEKWVADRYRRLLGRAKFKHQRRVGEVVLPKRLATGLVSITRGSKLVTPDTDADGVLDLVGPGLVGRFFRAANGPWYRIAGEYGNGRFVLETPIAEATNATASYEIVARYVKLAKDVRWLAEAMVHGRLRTSILMKSQDELNLMDPDRWQVGPGPVVWSEFGGDEDGVKVVEMYPPAKDQDEIVYYAYWAQPPQLTLDSPIPPEIDEHVLVEGALIDVYRYEASQAARKGMIESAAYWRNEYRMQETSWEKRIPEAIRADRGVDDFTFILQGSGLHSPGDIVTARDEVYRRGRP